MEYRQLGTDGPEVSAVGYGAMVLSQDLYGEANDDESIETIRTGLDAGLSFIDTADLYGNGHNERLIGTAIEGRRDDVVLATKGGYVLDEDDELAVDGSPEHIREAIEDSLDRLGVDTIDVYYLHAPDPEVPIEESVEAMAGLVDEGLVNHLGVSNVSAEQLRRAAETHPIAALQQQYSLFHRDPELELLPTCRDLGISLVAYSPLGQGFLSGSVTDQSDIADDDFRNTASRFQGENFEQNLKLAEEVRALADDLDIHPAQLSLAWLLEQGDDIIPIPGTRSADHLKSNLAATELSLDDATKRRLNEALPIGASAGDAM